MIGNLFQKYITTKNVIFFIIAILFLVFISKIQDIAILFFASYVIACSFNPLVDKLQKKFKRPIAAGMVLGGFIVILCAFFIPLIYMSIHEIKSFAESAPTYVDSIFNFLQSNKYFSGADFSAINIGGVLSYVSGFTGNFLSGSILLGKNISYAVIYLIVAFIITFYFMADKEVVRNTYLSLFPSHMQKKAGKIIDSISLKIGGYVIAQVVTMASVGIIMIAGLLLIKLDYAVLLGFITAILDIIPVVGPGIALIICLLVAYKSGALIAILTIVIFAIAQLTENNFVRPYVFGKILNLHPLIIYLFLLITAKYLGVIGVIFAPAIAATIVVLIEELYIKSIK